MPAPNHANKTIDSVNCAVITVSDTRTEENDASGKLTGYTVEETLALGMVARPLDRAVPVDYFETGTTVSRKQAKWPPRGTNRRSTSLYERK